MSIELSILKSFCASRGVFDKYNPYIIREHGLDKEIKILFYVIQSYYEKYKKSFINKDALIAMYDYMYQNAKDRNVYMEAINHMWALEIDIDQVTDNIEKLIERQTANDIINVLAPVVEGDDYGKLHEIQQHIDEYLKKLKNPPKEVAELEHWTGTVKDLVDDVHHVGGYKFPKGLGGLNAYLGTLYGGLLGCLFAYSDVGKSSAGLYLATSICYQMELNAIAEPNAVVAYCGNEEAKKRMMMRSLCSTIKATKTDIAMNYTQAQQLATSYGWHRLKMFDSVTHIRNVEKILEKLRPKVMFIDQGTKVSHGYGQATGDVKDLQIIFNIYRELAKQYDCCIICLAQAMGKTANQKLLTLDDIYGSRVAIQGELDFAIGIGRSDKDQSKSTRYFNVCKNKLHNGAKGWVSAIFDNEKCRFKGGR